VATVDRVLAGRVEVELRQRVVMSVDGELPAVVVVVFDRVAVVQDLERRVAIVENVRGAVLGRRRGGDDVDRGLPLARFLERILRLQLGPMRPPGAARE
jgi:hypothetical protein